MLIGHILLFKLKDRKVAQSVAALGRHRGLKFSLISSGFGETMVKCRVDTSPVLNPPLATPDLMPSAANCAKHVNSMSIYICKHELERYLDEMQKKPISTANQNL